MQAAFCVLFAVVGIQGDTAAAVVVPEPLPAEATVSPAPVVGEPCQTCGASAGHCGHHKATATGKGWFGDWFGPMPQTCYQPRFGCYPGNPRTIHRYPAFHGTYYRAPYNYRQYMDYPWFATPHEPVGYFGGGAAGNVIPGEEMVVEGPTPQPTPAPQPLPQELPVEPAPTPAPAQ